MSHHEIDIPELHAALSQAAARTSRAPARRVRRVRLQVTTALCVAAVALAGVVGVGSATGVSPISTDGPTPAAAPTADSGLLRCVLAAVPAALVPDLEVGRDERAC